MQPKRISHTPAPCRLAAHIAAMSFCLTGVAGMASAASFDISSVPLYLGGTIEPNILFILDDSGSMQFEAIPESLTWTNYLFPPVSNMYGGSIYDNRIIQFSDTSARNVQVRSSHNNKIFYNPNVTYLPWVNQDNVAWANINPVDAPFNPQNYSRGKWNLTTEKSFNRWRNDSGTNDTTRTYWPITFYVYKGSGAVDNYRNYVKYQIRGTTGYRQDLNGGSEITVTTFPWGRSVAQETQNFANWFSYYRSRILTARAGIGRGFAAQGEGMRVGFGAINTNSSTVDGKSGGTVIRGVRRFESADRAAFFSELYGHTIPAAGTPLRRALDDAGQYFSRTDDRGPWSTTPGATGGTDLSCRQSYTILMTDGYWSEGSEYDARTSAARDNVDGVAGSAITGPGGESYTYSATSPFSDSYSDTLADVAMYYWKRDLRTDVENRVPTTTINPAFWQHMSLFGIGLGVEGTVSPDAAFAAIDSGTTIPWGNPLEGTTAVKDARKVDDLLHASVNARGGFFSASDPDEFAQVIKETLESIGRRSSSASAAAVSAFQLSSESKIFRATYESGGWTGDLAAYALDPVTGQPTATPSWSAAALIPAHGSRSIFTWSLESGGTGVPFLWSSITTAQKGYLNNDARLLNYLRGEQLHEVGGAGDGVFRARAGKLGDIVNSDPAYVASEDYGYATLSGIPLTQRTAYVARKNSAAFKERPGTLYVGANDGMLHAFDASTGVEKFAFIPNSVFPYLKDLADPDYAHRYYVDGAPKVGDAWIGTSWKTVLVGSTGAGGRSYFALDVENPNAFGADKIMWEFSHAELGYTIGQASIVMTEGGDWVAIFGNGYNSDSHKAQLFVVRLSDGALLARLDTGVGSATTPNGLATPVAVDFDQDGAADMAYAADMLGNVWKFDLTSTAAANWKVAFGGKPLFQAKDSLGNPQSITAKPQVAALGGRGVYVYIGTGQFFERGDQGDMARQSLYGIKDECGRRVTGSDCEAATGASKVARTDLLQQFISYEYRLTVGSKSWGLRQVTNETMSFAKKGFFIDLISPRLGVQGERITEAVSVWSDRVIFVTRIPNSDPCSFGGSSWLMEVDPATGGRLDFAAFDLNGDGLFDMADWVPLLDNEGNPVLDEDGNEVRIPPTGILNEDGMMRMPAVLRVGDTVMKNMTDTSGQLVQIPNKVPFSLGRQSWRQLR